MLYNYLAPLADDFQIFNLFRYLTFRTGGAILTSLILSFKIGPKMIEWLRNRQERGNRSEMTVLRVIFLKRVRPLWGGYLF